MIYPLGTVTVYPAIYCAINHGKLNTNANYRLIVVVYSVVHSNWNLFDCTTWVSSLLCQEMEKNPWGGEGGKQQVSPLRLITKSLDNMVFGSWETWSSGTSSTYVLYLSWHQSNRSTNIMLQRRVTALPLLWKLWVTERKVFLASPLPQILSHLSVPTPTLTAHFQSSSAILEKVYNFKDQIWVWSTRLIWYVCRLWDMVFSWRFER